MKIREKALQSLRIKGAFAAQELYDKHRGMQGGSSSTTSHITEKPVQRTSLIEFLSLSCSTDHLRLCRVRGILHQPNAVVP